MELGYISPEQLPVFRSLLLPKAALAIEQGEPVTAIGLTDGEIACGAAAGYLEGGRFQVISFYVAPDYRRQGGGRMMMETLIGLLRDLPGAAGLESSYTRTAPEHETLAPFLTALGFAPDEDRGENLYLTTIGQTAASPFFSAKGPHSKEILPFSQVPAIYLSLAEKKARMQDVPLPEFPLNSPELDREVSCALVRNREVQALVTFDRSCMDQLTLSCAWAGSAGPTVLPALLRDAFRRAAALYSRETPLAVQAVTPAAAALIRALLPDARPISSTYYRPLGEDSE